MALIEYRDALNQAFAEEIERDPNVVLIGEEVAQYDAPTSDTRSVKDLRQEGGGLRSAKQLSSAWVEVMVGLRRSLTRLEFCDRRLTRSSITPVRSAGAGRTYQLSIVIRGPANGGTNVGATHSTRLRWFAAIRA
jgi:pyruvate dehydrogenase E1 component beta subunit